MNLGQASKTSGVSQRMIRHYEAIGLTPKAARRDSGYRDYDERDVHRLKLIALARDLGFPNEEMERKERELQEMRLTLERLAQSCHGDERPDCPIIESLASGQAAAAKGPLRLNDAERIWTGVHRP